MFDAFFDRLGLILSSVWAWVGMAAGLLAAYLVWRFLPLSDGRASLCALAFVGVFVLFVCIGWWSDKSENEQLKAAAYASTRVAASSVQRVGVFVLAAARRPGASILTLTGRSRVYRQRADARWLPSAASPLRRPLS